MAVTGYCKIKRRWAAGERINRSTCFGGTYTKKKQEQCVCVCVCVYVRRLAGCAMASHGTEKALALLRRLPRVSLGNLKPNPGAVKNVSHSTHCSLLIALYSLLTTYYSQHTINSTLFTVTMPVSPSYTFPFFPLSIYSLTSPIMHSLHPFCSCKC